MLKNIIGADAENYKKKLNISYVIIAFVVLFAVAVNLTLCLLYSEQTHAAFLAVNIIVDIAAVWFILFFTSLKVTPKRKLLSFVKRASFGEKVTAEVRSISESTTRVGIFNCFEIITSDERRFYLAEIGAIKLNTGLNYTFTLVENIVVEVEDEQGN